MLQALRERATLIFWIVIITFVGGMVFLMWGVGDTGRGRADQPNNGAVATVNGQDISFRVWNERVNGILAQMRQQLPEGQTLSENQILRAREQAFDDVVMETLQRQAAARQGYSVTDEEIVDILANNPPQEVLAYFVDENGRVDREAYARALREQPAGFAQVEQWLRTSVPIQKLQNMISGRALVSETEIRQAFAERTVSAVAEYVVAEYSGIELEDAEIPEDQIEAFYQEHREEYKVPEQAVVNLVVIPNEASEEDEQEVLSIIQDIRQDVVNGRMTFAEAAQTYSEDASNADKGGDLGFFDRERMVKPFTDAAFALEVGQVSEPVRTQFGYHLIQVEDEKRNEEGERTEVRARHLLLKVSPSPATEAMLQDQAEALREAAAQQGLSAAAEAAGMEVTTTSPFQESFNIPGVANSIAGARFAFQNDVGALSPVFRTEENFYLFEIAQRIPAGHRDLDEVRSMVISRLQRERRADVAAGRLAEAWKRVQEGASLQEAAEATDLTYAVTDSFTLRENIPGVGFATAFARAALELEPGQMLPEVRTTRGVYIIHLLQKTPFDEEAFAQQRTAIARSLLFSKRQQVLAEWQQKLKDEAQVVDRRAEVL